LDATVRTAASSPPVSTRSSARASAAAAPRVLTVTLASSDDAEAIGASKRC